jgi:hypothetical protein
MNPLDFALVADENIAPELVAALRERRIDVGTLHELGLDALDTLRSTSVDVDPPFLIVVERKQNRILIRLRQEP